MSRANPRRRPSAQQLRQTRESGARAARARRARRGARQLAYARLWHRDAPRTSQRRTVARFLTSVRLGTTHLLLVLGGNRTGKTELGAQLTVAHALGGDHPDVLAWCALNGLDASAIPLGPGKVCASALTGPDSMRYLRDKLDRYLPAGSTWYNRFGQGEAWVKLPNGGLILCKSNDQGRRSFQGDSWRFVWLDEEHDEPIYDEAVMRLLDQGGTCCMTMTPLKGFTWVYDRWVAKADDDAQVAYLYMEDNPHLPAKEVARIIAKMSDHQKAARTRGAFMALEGLIYPEWQPHLHVIDPFPLPPEWPRFRWIDFGTRAPFACVWVAWDKSDDTVYLYREHYDTDLTTEQHAELIEAMEKAANDPHISWTAADPAGLDQIKTLKRRGWDVVHPGWMKDISGGIGDMKDRLRPDAEGKPHLKVFRGCVNFIREMHAYIWAKGSKEVPHPECSDHALDGVRYGVRYLRRQLAAA